MYSIDECFIDATSYLKLYNVSARNLAKMMITDVLMTTGICATAGIGTNLFLAKVALDIRAKHAEDFIGYLDIEEFKKLEEKYAGKKGYLSYEARMACGVGLCHGCVKGEKHYCVCTDGPVFELGVIYGKH